MRNRHVVHRFFPINILLYFLIFSLTKITNCLFFAEKSPYCNKKMNIALFTLMFVGSASAAKPDQPGKFQPSAPVNSVVYLEEFCNYMEMTVTISTYISGYQIFQQGMDDDLARATGKEYFDGPQLILSGIQKDKGQFCSGKDDAPKVIPPRSTGIIAYGSEKGVFTYDSIVSMKYKVYKKNGAELYSNGCELRLFASSQTGPEARFISIDLVPNSACAEWPNLKIASSNGWCEFGLYSGCRATSKYGNLYKGVTVSGRDFFVYWDDASAKQEVASINDSRFDAFLLGPAAAPSVSEEFAAPLPPTSAAFKASAQHGVLVLFVLPILFCNTGFNKRGILVCLLLVFVLNNGVLAAKTEPINSSSNSTQSENATFVIKGPTGGNTFSPPDRIDFLKFLADTAVAYINTWGRCKSYISETIIQTGINGDLLDYRFYDSPVGMNRYGGPKLELIPSRTWFHFGNACNDENALPVVIESNSVKSIFVGDSYFGLASSEVDLYYKVYKPDGSPSDCVIKIYINDIDSNSKPERKPTLKITKEPRCDTEIPNLEINYIGHYCEKNGVEKGFCYARSAVAGKLASWGSAANVYFRGVPMPANAAGGNGTAFNESNNESDSKAVVDGTTAEAPSTTSSATKPIISFIIFVVIAIFH